VALSRLSPLAAGVLEKTEVFLTKKNPPCFEVGILLK
jgi:hypothetical protein